MKLDSLNKSGVEYIPQTTFEAASQNGLGVDTIVVFTALAGIIFGFFYLLKKYIFPLWDSRKALTKVKLLTFRIEVIVWLLFTLVALTQLFSDNLLLTAALVIIILWVGLNFWKDFFPGLLFRVSNKFLINDPIRFGTYSGNIVKLGRTTLHIKTEEEELVFIPYHKISQDVFVKRQAKGKIMSSKIVLAIGRKDPDEVIQQVNQWIHECPWAIPQSENTASIQPGGLLNVTVYAIDHFSLGKVERHIKSNLENL